ncbi:MAG: ROK family transcriptional regulator [Enterococcus casseliflavus]|nr:ROK family transcriptional regulator [Enterococcus casseliflavus]
MIINKMGIREQNEAAVLKTIIDNENVSRAEVSNLTHLNKASVSQITKKLIDTDFVREVGIGDSTSIGGRKPIQLQFNHRSSLAVTFDIGYNYVRGMLSYINGEMIASADHSHELITKENVLATIDSMMKEFWPQMPQTTHGLVGICLAIHGIVHNQTITFAPYYDLEHFDLIAPLSQKYNTAVYIENEANLTALGEYCFSSDSTNLLSVSVHSGIGVGIIVDGQLQTGTHGMAGEVGHSTLFPHGNLCPCGNRGCLEQYASNKVLFDTYSHYTKTAFVNSDTFAQAYHAGEKSAVELAQQNVEFLSIGLNNVITFSDPEEVYINSSVYRKIPDLLMALQQKLTSQFTKNTKIKNSRLGDQAPLFGGNVLVAKHFLNINDLRFAALDLSRVIH